MWPALLVLAGSMLAKHMANKQAVNRQNSLQQAMQSYQVSKARGNEQAINQMLGQQTADARAKELQGITTSREGTMQSTVDAARAASPVTQVAGTNTSPDYQKASEAAATRVSDKTKRAIQQLAVMGAPGEQGVASGIRFGRTAGKVDAGNAAIANVGEGYMRDINNVRPNPYLTLIGDAGMAVGGGMLGGGVGAAAGAQPNLVSPNNAEWGGMDAGPGAYSMSKASRPRFAWPKGWGG